MTDIARLFLLYTLRPVNCCQVLPTNITTSSSSGSIVAICLTFSKHTQKLANTKQKICAPRCLVTGLEHAAVALYIAC